jgi:thiol-disulfide isomerase/thioredoxin
MGRLWFGRRRQTGSAEPPSSVLPTVDDGALRWVIGDTWRDAVVVFWRPSCPPCYAMTPALERLAADFPTLMVVQADVDVARGATDRYDVVVVPTAIRFHHRRPAAASAGVTAYEELLDRLFLSPPA